MTGAAPLGARQPQAIQSALTVLEEVARCGSGVTGREISDNLGLPKATAYRLLNLLVQDEYLVRMPDLRGFALGRKVVELARLVAPAQPPQAVREVVDRLRSRIRGGIHLVRYDSDGVRVIDADPDYPPSVSVGSARTLETSAMGRLLLAERREGDTGVLGKDPVLAGQLATIRAAGYAYFPCPSAPGHGCLAIPIRDREVRSSRGFVSRLPRRACVSPPNSWHCSGRARGNSRRCSPDPAAPRGTGLGPSCGPVLQSGAGQAAAGRCRAARRNRSLTACSISTGM